jgi:hypothetical protein
MMSRVAWERLAPTANTQSVWRSKSHEVVDSDVSLFLPHLGPLRYAKNSICDSDHAECGGMKVTRSRRLRR